MQRLDGKKLADAIREELKKEIQIKNLSPKLGVVLVGEDPASHLYVNVKEKAAADVGIATDVRRVSASTPDHEIEKIIQQWNTDPNVHGILVQMPLPAGHDIDAIINAIDPNKDVDGFHSYTIAELYAGRSRILSPVHEGIMRLIATTGIQMNGASVTIIANSDIFSKPLEYLLRKSGAFLTVMSPDELDKKMLLASNVIITATGRAHILDQRLIPSGSVVIDVGTSRTPDGRLVGDVDAKSVEKLAGWLTPVPGGVGPMTIAVLLKNTVFLAGQTSSVLLTPPSLPQEPL